MKVKDIKAELSKDISKIEELLSHFGFHSFSYNRGELRCAVPDGDNPSSVAVRVDENLYCSVYTRNLHGDIFQIIEDLTDKKFVEILNVIKQLFGYETSRKDVTVNRSDTIIDDIAMYKKDKRMRNREERENTLYDESILNDYIITPHIDIYREGISPEAAQMFNIAFDIRRNRILFPHYDWHEFDKIVGIKGRIADMTSEECKLLGVPKYYNYILNYQTSKNLYGWHLAKENVLKENKLIIFESEKSVLKQFTIERGKGYSVAISGHELSKHHLKFIVNNTPIGCEIILAFDKDIMVKKRPKLLQTAKEISRFRPTSYIFDPIPDNKLLGEKDAPIDRQIKVWRYLMSCRVQV